MLQPYRKPVDTLQIYCSAVYLGDHLLNQPGISRVVLNQQDFYNFELRIHSFFLLDVLSDDTISS